MKRTIPTRRSSERARAATSRSAFSLIEILTVMTVATFLFGITVSMLHTLLQRDHDIRAWSASDGEVARLVDVLRDDVRRGTEVSSPSGDLVVVALPDKRRIEYRLDERFCRRNSVGSDETEQSSQLFSIGLPGAWHVERADSDHGPLITVRLNRLPKRDIDPVPPAVAVCAALGADRWTSSTPSTPSDASSFETSSSPDEAQSDSDEP